MKENPLQFISLHLHDAITEFVNYRKLDEKIAKEIEDAIWDLITDCFETNRDKIN